MIFVAEQSRLDSMENQSHEEEICALTDSICELQHILESNNSDISRYQDEINQLGVKIVNILEEHTNYLDTSDIYEYVGDFLVTSYCSCKICCGKYAENRPTHNGQELVFTATGELAVEGITVAVDPRVIPQGTKIYIEGVGVRIAQDTGGAIKGNRLDVYYDSHQEALHSGLNDKDRKVWILNENF